MYLDNLECWRGDEAVRSSIKGQLWPVYNTMAEVAEVKCRECGSIGPGLRRPW